MSNEIKDLLASYGVLDLSTDIVADPDFDDVTLGDLKIPSQRDPHLAEEQELDGWDR